MIKHSLLKIGLIIGAVVFVVVSSMAPMILGSSTTKLEQDHLLEHLAFVCREPNGFNKVKYEHYKQQLIKQLASEENYLKDAAKPEHTIVRTGTQSVSLFFGLVDSAWPMKCHDTYHTGRSPNNTSNTSAEKWRFYFSGYMDDSPTIDADGTIYCKGAYNYLDRYLYAINPDGTEKWKYKAGGLILGSSPAISDDGTIYFGCWDSYLYALYRNGTLKWRFLAYDCNIASSSAIAEDGTVYFGGMGPGDYGRIYAVNPNGTEKWHYDTGYLITSDPAIADDGTIYIGSGDTYLYAMYPNGTLRWRFKTGDYVKGPPSITDDGTIYIGSFDDYLYALYPNGTMKWKCIIGQGTETNPSLAADGTIYVGSYDGHLYAVNPNGTMKWSLLVIGNIHKSSPAISADGTIYFGTDATGMVYAVNPDGTEKWHKKIADEWVESSPSIAEDGTVYIGSSWSNGRGYLHAFGQGPLKAEANGPYTTMINQPVQLTGFIFGGTPPYTCHWDFGDGNTSGEQNPTHIYGNVGNFTVTFSVTDSDGNQSNGTSFVIVSAAAPSVTITKPVNGIYLMDMKILPFPRPLIIGKITIQVEASQEPFGIDRVEFYIDGELKATDSAVPYQWTWSTSALFKHTIKAVAYDTSGKSTGKSIGVSKFF